jgi:hypothetical protein
MTVESFNAVGTIVMAGVAAEFVIMTVQVADVLNHPN